jgi:Zn ribbon nucleic-acid-binding protein
VDDIKLNPGEILCPKCKGSGKGKTWKSGDFEITPECSKCLGDGKFDWIERVTGKRRPFDYIEQEIIDKLSEELREEIDREILEKIGCSFDEKEQKKKEEPNDNRVISEFMFRTTDQQIIKGQTN